MGIGERGLLMERDLATHHLAAGDPVLVIAALDPKHTRDHPVVPHKYDWRGPVTALQLAEAVSSPRG